MQVESLRRCSVETAGICFCPARLIAPCEHPAGIRPSLFGGD